MHKLLPSIFLFLILALPFSAFAHEGEDHSHDESASELDGGNGWRLVRKVELGTSGKFVNLVLIDHAVYTDKTIYSAVINRLCSPSDQFCRIRFWSEERFIPVTTALSVEQNKQLRADYLVNKVAGMHHLRWSCTVDPDKTHCF